MAIEESTLVFDNYFVLVKVINNSYYNYVKFSEIENGCCLFTEPGDISVCHRDQVSEAEQGEGSTGKFYGDIVERGSLVVRCTGPRFESTYCSFEARTIFFTPLCLSSGRDTKGCWSLLPGVYDSMPGEVKDPTQSVNVRPVMGSQTAPIVCRVDTELAAAKTSSDNGADLLECLV